MKEKELLEFIDAHRDESFWYLPRARYFNREDLEDLQKVLQWMNELRHIRIGDVKEYQPELSSEEIDPNTLILREWDQDLQVKLFDKMVNEGIISPTARDQTINDKLANLRNHFNILKKLGFAYKNKENKLFISEVGTDFMEADSEEIGDIIERQLLRLQFSNPSLESAVEEYEKFKIFPYLFTLQLLNLLPDNQLSTEEFFLFVVYAENMDQIDYFADLITYYRSLQRKDQLELRKYADPNYPKKANARVHLTLYGATPTLSFEESKLTVLDEPRLQYLIGKYTPKLRYVEYEQFEDWYSYIGGADEKLEIRDIVTYYSEIGKDEKARELIEDVELEEELEEEAKSLEELLEEIFSEKILEKALEKQPSLIEHGLSLIKNGRQYRTDVGPIDLLCQDPNGRFVVVELKKGRTADKVVGQTLRYMGWVRLYLSPTNLVRGIIVGRAITDKVKFAREGLQHPEPILNLKEFSLSTKGDIKEVETADLKP